MDLSQLTEKWAVQGEKLYPFPATVLTHPQLSVSTVTYLSLAGLPREAAPSLGFLVDLNPLKTPNQYFRIAWEGLDNYLVIGTNGSGDPVCVDLKTGNEIIYLNHDHSFERIFINTTVEQFSHCLLGYKLFYDSLTNRTDPDDCSFRKFTDDELDRLRNNFENIDPQALSIGSFWEMELNALAWERDQ